MTPRGTDEDSYTAEVKPDGDRHGFPSFNGGSVEVGRLGLVWSETDLEASGVTGDSGLMIGRRYVSRAEFDGPNSTGPRWVHSCMERLLEVYEDRDGDGETELYLRYVSWDQPYNDPDHYLVPGPDEGTWTSHPTLGATAAASSSWPGASYRLDHRNGRTHHFNAQGQILARTYQTALNAITFNYDSSGNLTQLTDTRGQNYTITTKNRRIETITTPTGAVLRYHYRNSDGQLVKVTYPSRAVTEATAGGDGGTTVTRKTTRKFRYNSGGRLKRILNDADEVVFVVAYQDENSALPAPDSSKVWKIQSALGAEWEYAETLQSGTPVSIDEWGPRGFRKEFMLNAQLEVTELRQYIQSQDIGVPSRPIPPGSNGYYSWGFLRDPNCPCAIVRGVSEPNGGGLSYIYNSLNQLTELRECPPSSSGLPDLVHSWTYDTEGRILSYASPYANAATTPADWTQTYTYSNWIHPVTSVVGTEIKVSNPAGSVHGGPVEWVSRYDDRRRPVEFIGPSYDGTNPGSYEWFDYWSDTAGVNSALISRHSERADKSVFQDYTYNAYGDVLTCGVSGPSGTIEHTFTNVFDSAGYLREWIAPNQGSQTYRAQLDYDAEGRTSNQRYLYFDRAPSSSGTDSGTWIETSYFYNAADLVVSVEADVDRDGTQPLLVVRDMTYDSEGRVVSEIGDTGKLVTTQYDERGLPWIITDAAGTSQAFEREVMYRDDGEVKRFIEDFDASRQVTTVYEYDEYDRLNAMEVIGYSRVELESDESGRLEELSHFGPVGAVLCLTDRETYVYGDWHDGPTQRTHDVYEKNGTTLVRTVLTDYDYQPAGNLARIDIGGASWMQWEYEPWGVLKKTLDHHGNALEMTYQTGTGYVATRQRVHADPVSGSPLVLDETLTSDPAGRTTAITYHTPGEPDRAETFEHDSLDNVVGHVDTDGTRTERTFRFDSLVRTVDRDVSGTNAASSTTYVYTDAGLLDHFVDHRGNEVHYRYDDQMRLYREIQPDGTYWEYNYLLSDFVESIKTPTDRLVEFTYQTRGLPNARTIRNSSGQVQRTDAYTWSPSGHLASAIMVEGTRTSTVSYERDGLGLVLLETQDGVSVSYDRDTLGRVDVLQEASSGYAARYVWDDRNRPTHLYQGAAILPANLIAQTDYLGIGQAVRQRTMGDGTTLDVLRDAQGLTSDRLTTVGGTMLLHRQYAYGDEWLPKYEDRVHQGVGDVYGYDGLRRLTQVVASSDDPPGEWAQPGSSQYDYVRDWHLDGDDHRTQVVTTPSGGSPSVETYLIDPDRHQYTNVGGVIRQFDVDGKLTWSGQTEYQYDALDQLVGIVDHTGGTPTVVAAYAYDAVGRRQSVTEGGETRRFTYAGQWILTEHVDDGSGEVLDALHYHAGRLDEVLLTHRRDLNDVDGDGSTTDWVDLYHHHDRLGSTSELTLSTATVVESYTYDPFGAPTIRDAAGVQVASSPSGNRYLFTGREFDAESDLYHYRARAYDPQTGGFLQEDPLGYYDSVNPVAYALANPLIFTDPYGTSAIGDALGEIGDFISENRELLGGLLVDLISPLAAMFDALSAVMGYDVLSYALNGFSGEKDWLRWYERAWSAASALGSLGGAAAVLFKLDDILDKLRNLVRAAKQKNKPSSPSCSRGCFLAGTLVLMADGTHRPIEEVELGDAVASIEESWRGSLVDDGQPGLADHATDLEGGDWFEVFLRLQTGENAVEVELLRPAKWLESREIGEGGIATLHLTEMGVSGTADVVRVRLHESAALPPSAHPSSRVTGRFRSIADTVVTLRTSCGEELCGTPNHLAWSVHDGAWKPLESFRPGDLLRTVGRDSLRVSFAESTHGYFDVWNLEVHRTHLFHAGQASVLVHNQCDRSRAASEPDRNGLTKAGRALQKHSSRRGSAFNTSSTRAGDLNGEGQAIVDEILSHPESVQRGNGWGGVDVVSPDGRGIRYNEDGTFRGFLERPR